jgi:hypothetical protein
VGSRSTAVITSPSRTKNNNEVYETGNNALRMNGGNTDSFIIRGNHLHHTGLLTSSVGTTEGEGMTSAATTPPVSRYPCIFVYGGNAGAPNIVEGNVGLAAAGWRVGPGFKQTTGSPRRTPSPRRACDCSRRQRAGAMAVAIT